MATTTNKAMRSNKSSMEGMISNANHVLEQNQIGVFSGLFKKCIGICIISAVEAGFIFSGQIGSGIMLKKMEDGSWSPPCAMGFGGMGWGFLAGGASKDIIVFIFDKNSMEGMLGEAGARIGGQMNLTLGPFGRNYEEGIGISNKGALYTASVAFSKGAFVSFSVIGALVGPRDGVNNSFYGQTTTTRSIVNGQFAMPEDKPTEINELYEKLARLEAPQEVDSFHAKINEEHNEAKRQMWLKLLHPFQAPVPSDPKDDSWANIVAQQTAYQFGEENMASGPNGEMGEETATGGHEIALMLSKDSVPDGKSWAAIVASK